MAANVFFSSFTEHKFFDGFYDFIFKFILRVSFWYRFCQDSFSRDLCQQAFTMYYK
jgi:hypothetical protein